MPKTYEPIATQTLGTATTTITFSNIPQTYTDLVLVANAATPTGGVVAAYRFNGDSGNNYSATRFGGTGSITFSDREANKNYIAGTLLSSAATPTGVYIAHIMNYANTTTYKTALTRNNNPSAQVSMTAGLWRNTAAITSVSFGAEFTADVRVDSTFTLYGIKAA
jgi:hypothetical protein